MKKEKEENNISVKLLAFANAYQTVDLMEQFVDYKWNEKEIKMNKQTAQFLFDMGRRQGYREAKEPLKEKWHELCDELKRLKESEAKK